MNSTPTIANSLTVLFCEGCNEKFAVPADVLVCPQCGQPLTALADASTIAFEEFAALGTYVPDDVAPAGQDDSLVGSHLGTYHIEAFLGKGGMARVYRAKHLMLERICAVKVLNQQLVQRKPEYVHMFLSEARSAAALVHPHVVTIHTIGYDAGLHYIEMEYVAGRSLQRIVESLRQLDAVLATHFMVQISSALAEAHRIGMVHRDIKPANVLVSGGDVAKLADFGLAKRVVTTNRSGCGKSLAGTPHYMAPELFDGQSADNRTDVYAMGVTYFGLLAGRLPFADQSLTGLARRHATEPVADIRHFRPDVPERAAVVIARCLAKRPDERYPSATQLHQDLKAVYGGMRNLEGLVAEALENTGTRWTGSGDRFVVQVALPGGRSQNVSIESCRGGVVSDDVVKIYSICGPASEAYYRRALELNAVIPHGSIAIETIEGRPQFVMGNTYPRATCDPEEIHKSVLAIAAHADEIEKQLTGRDSH
jgi:serine/threonine-protein kinase